MDFINKIGKKTQRALLVAIVLNVIAIVFFAGAFFMVAKKELAIANVIEEIQNEYVRIEKKQSTKNIVRDTHEERKQLNTYFIEQDTVVHFIETIEELGTFAGVDLVLEAVDVTSGKNAKLSIRVSAKGSWEDLIYFLALSESSLLHIDIDSANVVKIKEGLEDEEGYWSGDFIITVHSFVDTLE
ncbi:hypothetical protein ACFLY0_02190 [Patescibacteria group bacterium]